MTFKIAPLTSGDNPDDWDELQAIIGEADVPVEPDAAYQPCVEYARLQNGQKRGMGLPSATWSFSALTPLQKYNLRQFCAGSSASVYIETPTNDFDEDGNRIWIDAEAIMEWMEGEEEIDANISRDFRLRFTRLVKV